MTHTHSTPADHHNGNARPARDGEVPFDRSYWEDRYGAPGLAWSGNPNAVLVKETARLTPGTALDIGSGEGGDALWLALRGWRVTGVDIAQNALDKARERVASIDPDAGSRIRWEQRDIAAWVPEPRSFDLVTSHFMHLAGPSRGTLFHGLAAAVAPGGTLLIVGHDIAAIDPGERQAHHPELMFTAADVLAAIAGERLRIDVAESRARMQTAADGTVTPMSDVIVRATRL